MRHIYMDNAATTKCDKEVLDAMLPYFTEEYGNPSSMHNLGLEAKSILNESRSKVAKILNCTPKEIIFTGSGTESDNMAILGFARKNRSKGTHIITTKVEHHAVLEPFELLEKEGFSVTYLEVGPDGILDPEILRQAIKDDTIFASIIYANNEIGSIQDIPALAKICRENGVVLHTDACQATNYCEMDVEKLSVDLMTLNGSKIYGPKGIGVLYKRKGIDIEPIVTGGGQEFKLRSGTENIPNIVGYAKALELVTEHKEEETARLANLRDHMIASLLELPDTKLNGHPTKRLANNVNISFLNIEGESVLLYLNEYGIYASTGSACSSDSLEPSHVIIALGLPHELGHSSIRLSLGKDTTREDVDFVLEKLPEIVIKLRKMSPLKDKMSDIIGGDQDG